MKLITVLTVALGLSGYLFRLYLDGFAERLLLKIEILNLQSVLLAILLYNLFNDAYWKVFCSYLILWRVSNVFITYINFDDTFPEGLAHLLSYTELVLFGLSIIHLGFKKWNSLTQHS